MAKLERLIRFDSEVLAKFSEVKSDSNFSVTLGSLIEDYGSGRKALLEPKKPKKPETLRKNVSLTPDQLETLERLAAANDISVEKLANLILKSEVASRSN